MQKFVNNMFMKTSSDNHFIICLKYNKVGNKILKCNIKRFDYTLVKQIQVPKEIMCSIQMDLR